jgi:hypothetical protein
MTKWILKDGAVGLMDLPMAQCGPNADPVMAVVRSAGALAMVVALRPYPGQPAALIRVAVQPMREVDDATCPVDWRRVYKVIDLGSLGPRVF